MKKFIVGLALFTIMTPLLFAADPWQQNFLHIPLYGTSASATSSQLDVTDRDDSSVINITIPQVDTWKVVSSYCSVMPPDAVAEQGNYRYWISLPQTNIWISDSSGLKYNLSNVSWALALTNNNNNQVYVGDNIYGEHIPNGCWDIGKVWGLGGFILAMSRHMSLVVTVARAKAYPGSYMLSIPFAWAYEENKGSLVNNSWNGFLQFGDIMKNNINSVIRVPVIIKSKCNIQNRNINLSHGDMTPDSSINHVTAPHNYQLSCDYDSSVSVSLVGSTKVSGKTENYTKCGNGGTCELKYNGDSYNGTFKVTAGTAQTLSITSTFHPNDIANPVEGSFSGGAILRVLVN